MKVPAIRMKSTIITMTMWALSVRPSIQSEITSGIRSNTMP
jgi:hypothetical protein